MKDYVEATNERPGEMEMLIERLHGVVGTAGDLCGIASRMADKLVGEEPEANGRGGDEAMPSRPGGNLGYIHGQLDEMDGRLRLLDRHITRIARL